MEGALKLVSDLDKEEREDQDVLGVGGRGTRTDSKRRDKPDASSTLGLGISRSADHPRSDTYPASHDIPSFRPFSRDGEGTARQSSHHSKSNSLQICINQDTMEDFKHKVVESIIKSLEDTSRPSRTASPAEPSTYAQAISKSGGGGNSSQRIEQTTLAWNELRVHMDGFWDKVLEVFSL
jgi:hypothetical protein